MDDETVESVGERLNDGHSSREGEPVCPECGHPNWAGGALGWRVGRSVRRLFGRAPEPKRCETAFEDGSSTFGGEVCGCTNPFHLPT